MAQNKIAETLKELRIHHGLTQDMPSSRLNISRQTLSNYETGKRVPDPDSLCVLAEFYHVTLDQLIRTGHGTRRGLLGGKMVEQDGPRVRVQAQGLQALIGIGAGECCPPLHTDGYEYPDALLPAAIDAFLKLLQS